jgi:hypothetical protein
MVIQHGTPAEELADDERFPSGYLRGDPLLIPLLDSPHAQASSVIKPD